MSTNPFECFQIAFYLSKAFDDNRTLCIHNYKREIFLHGIWKQIVIQLVDDIIDIIECGAQTLTQVAKNPNQPETPK